MKNARRKGRGKGPMRPRTGLLPGQYKRRALVTVEKVDRDGLGYELTVPHNYIVLSHRLDGQYSYTVEYRGATWEIPGAVMDAMLRHKDSITKEAKRRTALEAYARVKSKADRDQAGAEAERLRDLAGR